MTIDIGVTAQQGLQQPAQITGGEVEFSVESGETYKTHTFATSGELVVAEPTTVDILIVAGGGGGGSDNGGGGGAGGVIYRSGYSQLNPGTYSVLVGAGGAGAPATAGQSTGVPGSIGTNSELAIVPLGYFDAGGSAVFNGSTGYLSTADNTELRIGTQDFTIESWVYINNYKLANIIVSKSETLAANGWIFYVADSSVGVTTASLAESNTSPLSLEFSTDGDALYTVENGIVYQYDMSTPWDLTTAREKPQLNINAQEGLPRGIYISPDGVNLYAIGTSADRVFQYQLRTPWSIKSGVLVQSLLVSAQDTFPRAVQFSPDGIKMYVLGDTNDRIFEYTLSTAWNVLSAVYTNQSLLLTGINGPSDFYFRADGQRLYVLSELTPRRIYRYDLSTAWNITTATLSSDFRDVDNEASPTALRFKPDGTEIYLMGATGDLVYQYTLSEPWTLNQARFSFTQEASPQGFCFGNDGKFLYITGTSTDQIHRYELSVNWDISRPITYLDSSINYGTASGILETAPQSVFFKPDGLGFFIAGSAVNTVFELSVTVPWTFQGATLVASFPVTGEGTVTGIAFKSDGTRIYVIGASSDFVRQYDLSAPWSLSSVVAAGTFSINDQDQVSTGVEFSTDGTKMFMVGSVTNRVYQYTLSTAWDITTAVYTNVTFLLTQIQSSATWREIRFEPDGTQMYVISTLNVVVGIELTIPWDLSTAVYQVKTLNVAPFDGNPNMLEFDDIGSKLYVGGTSNDTINELNLSTPWDITTAVYGTSKNISAQDTAIGAVTFKDDGTKMFAVGDSSVAAYDLLLPWQVRSAVLSQQFYLETGSSQVSIRFSSDGLKFYVTNQTSISEYLLDDAWDLTDFVLSYSLDVSDRDRSIRDAKFKDDGRELYLIGGQRKIFVYQLSEPWDLSTAEYLKQLDVSSESNIPRALAFKSDGSVLYTLDSPTTIYQYQFSESWNIASEVGRRGQLCWQFQNQILQSNKRIELSTWTHVAVNKGAGVIKLFINGVLANQAADSVDYASTGEFRIGRGRNTSTNYYNGYLSNFRFTNGAALYNSDFSPSIRPLTASSTTALLTANSKTSLSDVSTNNFTLTANGTVNSSGVTPFSQQFLETKLITYGGGGGNSGHATVVSRAGGLAGGSAGGGAGEAAWITATTYNMNIGGESLQSVKAGAIAYSFNAESRLVIANNSAFDFDTNIDYTIETWFYIEGDSPLNASSLRRACIISAIGEAATTTTSYEFLINGTSTVTGTGFVVNIRNTSTTPTIYSFPATIPQREWHHVAFSKYGNIMSVYLNGVKIGEASDFTLKTTPGPNPIKIASVFATGTAFQPLIGKYSNLRVSRGLARYTGVEFTLPTEPYINDQYTLLLTCQGENYKDSSSNQFSITREGAVTINSSNTPFAKKTQFSGVFRNSAYLRADFALARFTSAAQPWTIECWLNEAPQAVNAYFIGINTIAAGANVLLVRRAAVVVGATTYTFSSAFETGQWNHFAMTYSGTVLKVYKNGQEVLNQTASMPSALYLSNFGIATEFDAADGGTPGDYYTGYIHDFRVVNSVVYTENFTPPTELLEDISGTTLLCLRNNTFTDDSSNKTLITLFNNPLTENISPYAVDEFVPVTRTSAVLDPAFGSVTFNGSTDYIDVASNFTLGTGDFTIEFWCNFTVFTADTAQRRILSQGAAAADRIQVYILAANTAINSKTAIRGSISLFTTVDQISTVMAVNDGKWHHVAFTRESGTLRSFVDGVLMDTRTGFTTNLSSLLGYRIGTIASSATSGNYAGSLANIRISAPNAWYTENFTPPQDNFFVDYLDFDFITEVKLLIQGPELFDISNNFYTTTPAGTVATSEDSPFLQTDVTVFAPVKRAIKSYGNRGGNTITGTTQLGGGGGGGAGAPGENTNTAIGGAGGDGIFATSFDAYYGGGGGGGNTDDGTDVVTGGQGGGGSGGGSAVEGYHNATANTGGGGGGSYSIALPTFYAGGNGGSGIVKIKYKSNRPTAVKNGDIISPIYNEISDSVPVSAVGPAASYTYFIDPQLPTGLTFNSATGAINGTSLSTIDAVFTVTVADTGSPSLRDSATFRLTITGTLTAVGGQQLTIIEEDQVYQVHKLTQSDFITVDNLGAIEYYIIGGGGAGGGAPGTADGSGGGGAGGYMVGTKTVTEDEFVSTVIYADSDFQDQGWTEDSDFTGTTGVIEFEKTITSLDNQISAGGARSNTISQSIKSYLEIKINDYANVNVGLCRSSSVGGLNNVPSINLDSTNFNTNDILQILYDGLNNKVYFGKNNAWSKNYLSPADGDIIADSGPLQVIVMANGPIDSTATMSAVFLRKENYRYPPPAGYTALGDEIAIFPVIIGAGGAGSTSTSGGNGGDTILFGVTALGGGGGATFNLIGKDGGSGGGAGGRNTLAGGAALQLALGGFGSAGGASSPTSATGSNAGGGGGGIPQINITRVSDSISAVILTSSPGQNAALAAGGAGGTGITLFDGEIYGSGGGASGQTTSGLGGSIYAGEGALSAGLVGASSGLANTGSGGGGSWSSATNGGLGGAGGSGVAFIRYRTQ